MRVVRRRFITGQCGLKRHREWVFQKFCSRRDDGKKSGRLHGRLQSCPFVLFNLVFFFYIGRLNERNTPFMIIRTFTEDEEIYEIISLENEVNILEVIEDL